MYKLNYKCHTIKKCNKAFDVYTINVIRSKNAIKRLIYKLNYEYIQKIQLSAWCINYKCHTFKNCN